MTKKLNKAAKATLAAALVASAIVPVASASANTTASISNVVVTVDGVQYEITKAEFNAAIGLGIVSGSSISHIKVDGKYYTKELLNAYIGTGKSVAESLTALTTSDKEEAITPTPGKFENGQLVGEPQATELKVESVSAISSTTVEVTFNKAVEALTKDNVTVTNTDTAAKQYIKSVTLSADGLTATVEFYEVLTSENTYNLVATVGENTVSKSFDFVVGDVAKIEAATTQVVKDGTVDLTELDYKVLDTAGLDITGTTSVTFESTVTPNANNQITLTDGTAAFVYVVAVKENGTVVKSPRITVKAEAPKVVAITNYTVAGLTTTPDFEEQLLTVQKGDLNKKIFVETVDQFGDVISSTPTYESLDKTVALVDQSTGKITALKEGTVPVKIKVGTVTKTFELTVVADAKLATIETDKSEITVSNSVTSPTPVKVTTKDQYGQEISGGTAAVRVISGAGLVTVPTSLDLSSNKGTLNVVGVSGKSGTAVIEIKLSDKIKTTVTVNVIAADLVDGYNVEGFETTLDQNVTNEDTESSMTLEAFPIDANGVKTGDAVAATYTVTNSDGEVVSTSNTIEADDLIAGETYTVTIKVGTIEVFKSNFSVINTASKPVVDQTTNTINADVSTDIIGDIKDAFTVTYDGVAQDAYELVDVTFVSDNAAVVDTATDATSVMTTSKEGTATLSISTITIDLDGDTSTLGDQYKVDVNTLINVKVVDQDKAVLEALDAFLAVNGNVTADTTDSKQLTSTIDADKVNNKVSVDYDLDTLSGSLAAFGITKTPAELKAEIEALVPTKTFDQITYADLNGEQISVTVDGEVYTLTISALATPSL